MKEGGKMASKNTLSHIKSDVDSHVGEKVVLRSNIGRRKSSVREGIIEKTYPSIFLVRFEKGIEEEAGQLTTYSYSDLLTKTIELYHSNDNHQIGKM